MKKSVLVFLIVSMIILSGCMGESQKMYICPSGDSVTTPDLCLKETSTTVTTTTILTTTVSSSSTTTTTQKAVPRTIDTGIICNEPYIRHGLDCCLDIDDDNICDVDEEKTTTSTTTTTTTTTSTTTTTTKLILEEIKYDDGTPEDGATLNPWGHAVLFTRPSNSWKLRKIKIYAHGVSDYKDKSMSLEVWDDNKNILRAQEVTADDFSSEFKWVEFDFPEVAVSDNFYIVVFTRATPFGSVRVGIDSSSPNKRSDLFKEGISDWSAQTEKKYFKTSKENVNWMIRAMGQ